MDHTQLNLRNLPYLQRPTGKVRMVLDTDAFNEIDDQFALSYALSIPEKLEIEAIYAAPFYNILSDSPADGMEKSYQEILRIIPMLKREDLADKIFRGSVDYLKDEQTPQDSPAARDLVQRAMAMPEGERLYVVAIGAITNVASALIMEPAIRDKIVLVWLGGHGYHWPDTQEFNMKQDIAAARVVFGCGIPLVQLPCAGVVDRFATSKYELQHWLQGKNALCDYLYENTVREAESYAAGKPWTRVIWDVTAVAWLLNTDEKFMKTRLIPSPIPEYDMHYAVNENRHFIRYVYQINRDALFEDLFRVLVEQA